MSKRKRRPEKGSNNISRTQDLDLTLYHDEEVSVQNSATLRETFFIELEDIGTNSDEHVGSDSNVQENAGLYLSNILESNSNEVGGSAMNDPDLSLEFPVEFTQNVGSAKDIYLLQLGEQERRRRVARGVFAWILWVLFATSLGLAVYYITIVILDYIHHSEIGVVEWALFV